MLLDVEFAIDQVTVLQVFLPILQFSPGSFIQMVLHIHPVFC